MRLEPLRDLDHGDDRRAGPVRDRHRVGHVIGVAVADEDVGCVDLIGARDRAGLFGFRKGSMTIRASPSTSSKQECP